MSAPIAKRLDSTEEDLLSALMASMAAAVYAVDDAGVVLFAIAAAVSILGYASESELIGRPSHATIHHSYPAVPRGRLPAAGSAPDGEPVRVDQDWFVRRDGSFVPVASSSAPVAIERRRGAVVVFRDSSERNRAEAERRRADAIHASRARIVQATLDERRRLGRDLHDGAQQRLINVIFALQAAGRDAGDASAQRSIAEALEETRLAIRDLRDIGAGLDPSVLAHRGLAAAITSLSARTPVPVTLERNGDGTDVTLLWDPHTDRVSIAVIDERTGEVLNFGVHGDDALAAFQRPYAYAPSPRVVPQLTSASVSASRRCAGGST